MPIKRVIFGGNSDSDQSNKFYPVVLKSFGNVRVSINLGWVLVGTGLRDVDTQGMV